MVVYKLVTIDVRLVVRIYAKYFWKYALNKKIWIVIIYANINIFLYLYYVLLKLFGMLISLT